MSEQVDLTTIPISPNGDKTSSSDTATPESGGKLITVFHDKDNFNVKHPLQNKWTLWFTKPSSGKVSSLHSSLSPSRSHVPALTANRETTGTTC